MTALLPGGDAAYDDAVEVLVEVKDALGAVSAPVGVFVTVSWPVIRSEAGAGVD